MRYTTTVLFLSLLFLSNCKNSSPTGSSNNSNSGSQNSPPSRPSISVQKSDLISGESTNLSATATDSDNDPLTYFWDATGGSFNTTSGSSVTWTSPNVSSTQNYSISVNVSDNNGASNYNSTNISVSPQFNSVTGSWELDTRDGFGNSAFTASMTINNLNLTQTNQLAQGYTSNVYVLNGNFSGWSWVLQRKSDGTVYPMQGASGDITNGAINANTTSHNLQFDLGSDKYSLKGVAPGYGSMWGDVTLKINMANIYGTNDGIITLTGYWDANRK